MNNISEAQDGSILDVEDVAESAEASTSCNCSGCVLGI